MTNESYPFRASDSPLRHQVYTKYLRHLNLNDSDCLDLLKRGLTREHMRVAEYASKAPRKSQNAIMAVGLCAKEFNLEGVPGFYCDSETRGWDCIHIGGIHIPVRDVEGNIKSLLIRDINAQEKGVKHSGKYKAFSSAGKDKGTQVRQTTHCPVVKGLPRKVAGTSVRITEGVLKADVATALGDIYCLGMHGLNLQEDLESVLIALEVSELIISLDAGEDKNTDMLRAKANLITLTKEMGIDVQVEVWDRQYGKGIDDVLHDGHKDKITYATEEEIGEILKSVKAAGPEIVISGGGLSNEATEGEKALIDAGPCGVFAGHRRVDVAVAAE